MATASVPNGNFVNGTPADADEVDANFAALVSFLNGSVVHRDGSKAMTAAFDAGSNKIVNVSTGTASTDAVNLAQLETATGAGAWTSYTPTITQSGAVTKTVTYAKYVRIGRTIIAQVNLAVTGSGTASNLITVSIPVTAAQSGLNVGVGTFYDDSPGALLFPCTVSLQTTSTVAFAAMTAAAGGWAIGSDVFTAGLASGDTIAFTITYEAAS